MNASKKYQKMVENGFNKKVIRLLDFNRSIKQLKVDYEKARRIQAKMV